MPPRIAIAAAVVLAHLASPGHLHAASGGAADLEGRFDGVIRPFLTSYCVDCHGGERPKAQFDLGIYSTLAAVARDHIHWGHVLDRLTEGDMPPEEAKVHPSAEVRREVIQWILDLRRDEALRNAGDPGIVLARRLSNAEYDHTIRDLTGVDIRPTREFPVDPANEAGFDNSGESLTMSPGLLKKYLEAARHVSEHMVLKPDGFAFAPHSMIADTDRDRYSVSRIIGFYQAQETNYAAYFAGAWRFQHRAALGNTGATLSQIAEESGISPKYLATVWSALVETPEEVGPLARLQSMWRDLPSPDNGRQPGDVAVRCDEMRDFAVRIRQRLVPEVPNLTGGRVNNGSQPLLMWKNRQWAANRRRYDPGALVAAPASPDVPAAPVLVESESEDPAGERRGRGRRTRVFDPDLMVPADPVERGRYESAFERFCRIFPDAFYVSERGRTYADQEQEIARGRAGRLLNAGFHSMTGYFRDDGPLYDMLLDERQRRELDQLWDDFFFMSSVAVRMHTSFLWFERSDSSFMMSPEFGFTRPEDKECTDEPVLRRLTEVFLAKARDNDAGETVLQAITDHFESVNANVRWLERARIEAVPGHVEAVLGFAQRAYRRPLQESERQSLREFYREMVEADGLSHEEAIRDMIVSVLMSPHFCYRIDLAETARAEPVDGVETETGDRGGASPLTNHALASRLSYFLWSSMPDAEVLERAASGDLRRPEVLAAQARRMLRDDRVRGLATEFAANWLDFRRFEEHNAVDRERFPSFNNDLRQAMFEEPIRFFVDLVQNGRPVLDFLYADHTFVNSVLAAHYGMDLPEGTGDWIRVDGASRYERGGLLPMSVFLTANSPGLRTSPVKRGYWVVRRVLGEHISPPPPDVPDLPGDEGDMGEVTLREALARHREDKNCAVCHDRFDSFGLVFEGFGPVGELRVRDLGGRPVDTGAVFPGGAEGAGLEGLRAYLRQNREEEFLENLCRKLLAYALGRSLMLSDDVTVQAMRSNLAAGGYRFESMVETIVTSPQFLNKRGRDDLAHSAPAGAPGEFSQ